ncbi:DUF655 domain-containing protein [Vulcanisaeta thermophila]|uniref:DUF655 domain-containing protein n=1 Tax=Vulcanisaeta thermophila TaxID=867917 RepID=UPI0008536E87|nr:DUF655 domain-containing protein [Vulcanisaeta thermophila]
MPRREDYAYILDTIPPEQMIIKDPTLIRKGFPRNETYVQAIGETYFTLLELTLKPNVTVDVGERVYIGSGTRDKIDKIVRRITYEELTSEARNNLVSIVSMIVKSQESRFVDFFNKAGPITIKLHSLELLKGIGKKTLWQILEERRKKPFQSFEDIKNRVGIDPEKLIIERILRELQGNEQYRLFVD